jgi:hypothetical protein
MSHWGRVITWVPWWQTHLACRNWYITAQAKWKLLILFNDGELLLGQRLLEKKDLVLVSSECVMSIMVIFLVVWGPHLSISQKSLRVRLRVRH